MSTAHCPAAQLWQERLRAGQRGAARGSAGQRSGTDCRVLTHLALVATHLLNKRRKIEEALDGPEPLSLRQRTADAVPANML